MTASKLLARASGYSFKKCKGSFFLDKIKPDAMLACYDIALREGGGALCVCKREDDAPPFLIQTASLGYVRLRLEQYSDDDFRRWVERLKAASWDTVYAYFMHDPTAPPYALNLQRLWSS